MDERIKENMDISARKGLIIVRPNMEKHALFELLTKKQTGDGVVEKIGPCVDDIRVGDTVVFGDNIGQAFQWQGDDLLVMRAEHVLGVMDQ